MNYDKKMSKLEFSKLYKQYKLENIKDRDAMILASKGLVLERTRYYYSKCFISMVDTSFEDFFAIGTLGLIKGVDRFISSGKTKLNEFLIFINKTIDEEIIRYLKEIIKNNKNISLEDIYSSKDSEYDEYFPEIHVIDNFETEEVYKAIRTIMKKLPDREKKMITMYFGFEDGKRYTQTEIAEVFGLVQSYVSRLIQWTVNEIGKQLQKEGLLEYSGKKRVLKSN